MTQHDYGTTLWLTGLSGSGKTAIASSLYLRLRNKNRATIWLDGDQLRAGLNRDLGFSKKDRSENIRRTAELAKLLNQSGHCVICSLISPFQEDRTHAKNIIGDSHFLEIYIDTPLEVCEKRDTKGLYKKARSGEIKEFTGISSPYEAPTHPTIHIKTSSATVEESAESILNFFLTRL